MVTAEQAYAWADKAIAKVRHLFHKVRAAVLASRFYQWLDRQVIDAPPIPALTFIGYVLTLTLTLFALCLGGIWIAVSNVREVAAVKNARQSIEISRLMADNVDLIKNHINEYALVEASLKECRAMLAAPKAPVTVIPKNKRGASSSSQKPRVESYRGPRPE